MGSIRTYGRRPLVLACVLLLVLVQALGWQACPAPNGSGADTTPQSAWGASSAFAQTRLAGAARTDEFRIERAGSCCCGMAADTLRIRSGGVRHTLGARYVPPSRLSLLLGHHLLI